MNKFLSRKFLISAAAGIAAFCAGVTGVLPPEWCTVGMAVSAGIYAASEAYVDGKSVESAQTYNATYKNVNANTDSTATANKIIAADAPKEA